MYVHKCNCRCVSSHLFRIAGIAVEAESDVTQQRRRCLSMINKNLYYMLDKSISHGDQVRRRRSYIRWSCWLSTNWASVVDRWRSPKSGVLLLRSVLLRVCNRITLGAANCSADINNRVQSETSLFNRLSQVVLLGITWHVIYIYTVYCIYMVCDVNLLKGDTVDTLIMKPLCTSKVPTALGT